jgi:hypothetical protein
MSSHTPTSAAEQLAGVGNVLVLAPGMATEREALCRALLERDDASRAVGVLYRGSPADWVERHEDAFPRGAFGVAVGGSSTALGVETVDSPDDLTGLEIAVAEAVDEEPVAFCLDSLTTLLQYADTDRACRFVHALTTRLSAAGATAHFHLDPAAVDDRTVDTLLSFVDASVRLDSDGEITVRRRPTAEE